MAEMNQTMSLFDHKHYPAIDMGGFAAEIEKHANTLADSGWMPEAINLRKWASELRGKSLKTNYAKDLLSDSID